MACFDNSELSLTCSLCSREYRDPRFLPCFHSFCASCIEKYIDKQLRSKAVKSPEENADDEDEPTRPKEKLNTFRCPTCREAIPVPSDGVRSFASNTSVKPILDVVKMRNAGAVQLQCDVCKRRDIAVAQCVECKIFLCKRCIEDHREDEETEKHRYIQLSECDPKNIKVRVIKFFFCMKHHDKLLGYYCHSCSTVLCTACLLAIEHLGHNIVDLDSVLPKHRRELEVTTIHLEKKRADIRQHVDAADAEMTKALASRRPLKDKVNAHADAMIKHVGKQRDELLEQLKVKSDNSKKYHSECMTEFIKDFQTLEITLLFLSTSIKGALDSKKVIDIPSIHAKVENFTRQILPKYPMNRHYHKYVPSSFGDDIVGEIKEKTESSYSNEEIDRIIEQVRMERRKALAANASNKASTNASQSKDDVASTDDSNGTATSATKSPDKIALLSEHNCKKLMDDLDITVSSMIHFENKDFILVHSDAKYLQVRSQYGEHKKSFGSQNLGHPWDVVRMPNGHIAVSDLDKQGIHIFDSEFRYQKMITNEKFKRIHGIGIDRYGNWIVTCCDGENPAELNLHKSDGTFLKTIATGFKKPWYLSVDTSGPYVDIVVVSDIETHIIEAYYLKGERVHKHGSYGSGHKQFDRPAGVLTDENGNIYVCDYGNNRVHLLLQDGRHHAYLATNVKEPWCVTFTKSGQLAVCTKNSDIHLVKYTKPHYYA